MTPSWFRLYLLRYVVECEDWRRSEKQNLKNLAEGLRSKLLESTQNWVNFKFRGIQMQENPWKMLKLEPKFLVTG